MPCTIQVCTNSRRPAFCWKWTQRSVLLLLLLLPGPNEFQLYWTLSHCLDPMDSRWMQVFNHFTLPRHMNSSCIEPFHTASTQWIPAVLNPFTLLRPNEFQLYWTHSHCLDPMNSSCIERCNTWGHFFQSDIKYLVPANKSRIGLVITPIILT